jgi:mannose-1-phosphate guanylyltransferase
MEYIDVIDRSQEIVLWRLCFAAFAANPDDILIITSSDHVIDIWSPMKLRSRKRLKKYPREIVTFGIVPH